MILDVVAGPIAVHTTMQTKNSLLKDLIKLIA
jgi:hypothetical protein